MPLPSLSRSFSLCGHPSAGLKKLVQKFTYYSATHTWRRGIDACDMRETGRLERRRSTRTKERLRSGRGARRRECSDERGVRWGENAQHLRFPRGPTRVALGSYSAHGFGDFYLFFVSPLIFFTARSFLYKGHWAVLCWQSASVATFKRLSAGRERSISSSRAAYRNPR